MRTKELTKTAVMAALVFVAIYVLKIPGPNGYSHLGDCMILISVLLLGGRKGAWAGGIGAALADLLGGYMQWVLPTFLIKAFMALIMGYVINKWHHKGNWLAGAVLGGIFQIIGYTAVKIFYYGFATAMVMTPGLLVQTAFGLVLTSIFVGVLGTTGILRKVKEM
ncbi:ECF transporter S component [Anaerotignum lactatifermentans]|uniref:ECF-type riboflavin transporter, S component n=1 Tax=Anaerotignum lactatifermentans DSM 14214 TaxID=1121323 RepID=A0A1M6PHU1_9FIRM|nr:ECF transporter S component [Anaerotignum lactatifermentans]SHK07492.1 ECF-type riboflavin transporter, S component [[Clostridium] lactatifermentans DSM 14214] [Anaerotignum lactatifermentans DSM 14214]